MHGSGDNKGYAALLLEAWKNPPLTLPGQGKFVGAFASANLGDISPNTLGAFCADTGEPCDGKTSTCNGRNELCQARGPGRDMQESCEIIGHKQFVKGQQLYTGEQISLKGDGTVGYKHMFVDMTNITVDSDPGGKV